MTLSLHVRQNGPEINPPVSRAQKTFDPVRLQRITAVLGADAFAYSTVIKYLPQRQFTSILVGPRGTSDDRIDQAIFDVLEHFPFSSIQELARLTCIPTSTVHRHFT
jgi:hypothetical protein